MRSLFRNLFPGLCFISLSTLMPAAEPVQAWLNRAILAPAQTLEQKPEMSCFGLLQTFDIKQLEALVAPRAIVRK